MVSSFAITFLPKETSGKENWNLYRAAFFVALEMTEALEFMDMTKITAFQVVCRLNACCIF